MPNMTTEMMTIVSANTKPYVNAMNRGAKSTSMFSRVVGRSLTGVTAALGGVVTAAAAMKVAMRSINLAAEFEQNQVAFEVLLKSADDAKRLMNEIQAFAAATPFQSDELQDAAKSLIAFGVESRRVVPTMRTLGNLSAGLGINIGELAEIYGKAKVQGRLFMEDINQLTGRGIPVIEALADQFGVAESEIRNMVSSGQVNFGHLEKAFQAMTSEGGKFDGMIQKQSETFNGLVSTLKDNVDVALRQVGQAMIESLDLKNVLKDSIQFIKAFTPGLVEAAKSVYNFGQGFIGVGEIIGASFLLAFNEAKKAALSFNDTLIQVAKKTAFLLEVTGQGNAAQTIRNFAKASENLNNGHLSQLANSNAAAALVLQRGSTRLAQARVGAFKNFGARGGDVAATDLTTSPATASRGTSFASLVGLGGGLASALIAKAMPDLVAAADVAMGPNSAILKGSSGAVSLEAERNRAQLDVGKSQLEELREIKQGISRLVDFGIGQKEKAVEAFGGLF